jgi:dipeptidyl aminopeptidase/acylaminoacyl peptidase
MKTLAVLTSLFFLVSRLPCKGQLSSPAIDSATITFVNPAVGFQAELEGLLQWPAQPGKYPLVVFIHGSGQGTRYEYADLSPSFLQKGYAVFSYDKRGVNRSGGTYYGIGPRNSPMMIPLLASDAYEAIEAIKKRPEINSSSVVLLGASQAGWIIPVVASMSDAVTHYVIMYGPTVTVGEEIYYSHLAEDGNYSISEGEKMLDGFAGLRGFDPLPYINRLKQKGLWLFGGKDRSVPSERSIQLLDSLNKSPGRPYTIKLYPYAGHGLKNMQTGLYEDYLPLLMDWLGKNMYRKSF